MFCPECRSEYRTGIARCAHCDVDLVETLPEETPLGIDAVERAVADGTAVVVARGPLPAASSMRELLAISRVPTVVRPVADTEDLTGAASVFDVLVHPDDHDAAAGALAADFQGLILDAGLPVEGDDSVVDLDAGGDITCPACGTVFQGEECPDCGLFLGLPDEG